MNDSADADRALDVRVARLVNDAAIDAPEPPDPSTFVVAGFPAPSPHRGPGRRVPAAVLGLIAVAAAALLVVAIGDDSPGTVRPGETKPPQASATIDTTSPAPESDPTRTPGASTDRPATSTVETVETVETVDTAEKADTAETVPRPTAITRPVLAAEICEPTYARERSITGLILFASRSNNPIPIQIIADPVARQTGPFALVERFFGDGRPVVGEEMVEINGYQVAINTFDNGNGQAMWDLGDGTHGYVRSRGLDRTTLLALLDGLTPRAHSAPIPGFDYVLPPGILPGGAASGLQLLHERLNTDVVGEVSRSECHVRQTDLVYQVSAISGDPVLQYGGSSTGRRRSRSASRTTL